MNKKGQETGQPAASMEDVVRLVLSILVVIFLIWAGFQFWNSIYGKNTAIKKSFTDLILQIDFVVKNNKESILPVYFTNKYDLVAFSSESNQAGNYEKPPECGLDYCLVLCKSGLIPSKDRCRTPIIYKSYANTAFFVDTKNPVLVNGRDAVINVNISIVDNRVYIKDLSK